LDGVKKIFSRPKKGAGKYILVSIVSAYIINISTGAILNFILHEAPATNAIKEQFNGSIFDRFVMLFKTICIILGEKILVILPLIIFVSLLVHNCYYAFINKKILIYNFYLLINNKYSVNI